MDAALRDITNFLFLSILKIRVLTKLFSV
uniref:Putative LRR receptor-like serine/threonine-protein kinase At1g56130 n=1 Tax=Rhizophora mucronata TaxID=61149 RepID=A0A2P2MWM9_RHIMU